MLDAADPPDDGAALKAMLLAARARKAAKDVAIASKGEHIARKDERIERLQKLVAAFKQQPSDANPRRPILTNSTWRLKTWSGYRRNPC